MKKTTAEKIGQSAGFLLWNIASSYWLILTINNLTNNNLPYDFPHLISSYFIIQIIERIINSNKK
jgi:hypothetical protein